MPDNKRERNGRMECKLLKVDKFSSWTDYIGEPNTESKEWKLVLGLRRF